MASRPITAPTIGRGSPNLKSIMEARERSLLEHLQRRLMHSLTEQAVRGIPLGQQAPRLSAVLAQVAREAIREHIASRGDDVTAIDDRITGAMRHASVDHGACALCQGTGIVIDAATRMPAACAGAGQ